MCVCVCARTCVRVGVGVGACVCVHAVYVCVLRGEEGALHCYACHILLICDKRVTTQNLAFLSY
jgi:hypothetical protein